MWNAQVRRLLWTRENLQLLSAISDHELDQLKHGEPFLTEVRSCNRPRRFEGEGGYRHWWKVRPLLKVESVS